MWVNTGQAATQLGKSARNIRRMAETGKIRSRKVNGPGRGGFVLEFFLDEKEKENLSQEIKKSSKINEKRKDTQTKDIKTLEIEKKSSEKNEKRKDMGKNGENERSQLGHTLTPQNEVRELTVNKGGYELLNDCTKVILGNVQKRQLSEMKRDSENGKMLQGGVTHGVTCSVPTLNSLEIKDITASFQWIPINFAVTLAQVTKMTIYRKIKKGEVESITLNQRTYLRVSDISKLVEMKWHEIQAEKLSDHLPAVIMKEKKKFEIGSQDDRDIAWARLSVIKSFYEIQELGKQQLLRKSEIDQIFLAKLEDREILKREMKLMDLDTLGLSTIKRWIKAYGDSGNINFPIVLLPKRKGKVGRKKIKADDVRARVRTLASEDVMLPASIIYRMLLAEFDFTEDTCPLRPSTVYSMVRKVRNDIFIMAGRKGKESYKNQVKPHMHRLNDVEPGDIWESDGHTMNNVCYNPFFFSEGYKPLLRPVLMAWFDVGTGMVTSWALGANESFHLMVTSFRAGLQEFGAPKMVRLDNGSGFKNAYTAVELFAFRKNKKQTSANKRAKALFARGYKGFFQECGVEKVQFVIPGNAESKQIEPAWRYTLVEFEKSVSLFMGETPSERPDKYKVSYKKLIKNFGDEILTWNEYVKALERAINDYNNRKRKVLQSPSGSLSPVEMYQQFPENIHKLTVPEIDYHCRDMFPKPVTVNRGEIKIMGMYYRHPLLVDYLGRKVNVYFDERNLENVQIGSLDGEIWSSAAKRIVPSCHMNPDQFSAAIKSNNHYNKEMIATYANIHNKGENLSIEQKNEIADASVDQLLVEQETTQEKIKNNQHKMITSRFTIENMNNPSLEEDLEENPEDMFKPKKEEPLNPFMALSKKVKG